LVCIIAGGAHAVPGGKPEPIVVEDSACRIEFDGETGALRTISNLITHDSCLKGKDLAAMPFRVYADLTTDFEITLNDRFQLVFRDPADITKTMLTPEACVLVDTQKTEDGLTLRYRGDGLEIELSVTLSGTPGVSNWALRIKNAGNEPRTVLACFPFLDGVRLGPNPSSDLATAMDQAGVTVPAWARAGGVLGESNQLSMQWHAIWDPQTGSALAIVFMDPEVHPKRLVLAEPCIALHHFPPVTLVPGDVYEVPPARVFVYEGDWRPAARLYRAWYDAAYPKVEPPEWFRRSNGETGRHFKKGGPGIRADYDIQYALESFRELPLARSRSPLDNWELAFYSHRCMLGVHTDGDNIVREDMGGPEALREGVAGSQRLGLHTTLYVEGYIVSKESDLARAGKAQRWAVMQKDGSQVGPYAKQGFYHMCPGCVEWQDHLAESVGRLLRETGADGVRLDSLGFYYLPCYNPAHNHADPFGYNEWIKQLLAKVRASAIAANPDVLLLTEGSADWFGQWFHGALTSRSTRDLTMMRLAVGPFRPYVYAAGALWGSLSGYAGGGCGGKESVGLDWNWMCARYPAHEALVWGDVLADPVASDREIVTRCFVGDGCWAIVAARPASQDPFMWPDGTTIADTHHAYTVTVPGLSSQVADGALCDIETLTWTPLELECDGDDLRIHLETNWALVILRHPDGPAIVAFDPPKSCARGNTTTLKLMPLTPGDAGLDALHVATVIALGLEVAPATNAELGEFAIHVPPDALPGNYPVAVDGENVLGVKRLLVVK
jgi:hypothetical protein